jgi:Domain of unknown function (DUF1996)/Carbohydrate binding module (family 6)
VVLGAAVAVAVGASGVYIANANAGETAAPLQAEAYSAQSGARTESTGDAGGGKDVGWLTNGDWLEYRGVTVTGGSLTARIASQNTAGGSVELRLGSAKGTLLATFPVASTGGWQKWKTVTAKAASVPSGAQDLFAVMTSKSRSDFVNLNWFTLGTTSAPSAPASGPSSGPASATASPTGPTTSASPSAPATTAGWVDVDQAAYDKELAVFDAVKPVSVPAGTTKVPEFHTDCAVSSQSPDDPIVLPNMPGASHLHTFFGAAGMGASTKASDLATAKTNCSADGDHSAYWVPQLQKNGVPVPIKSFRVYYGNGSVSDFQDIKPFPPGLVMVARDAKLQVATPKSYSPQFWCAGSAETGRSADGNWPVCATGGNLIFQLGFKSCWDGKHIDSPDHKSHLGDPVNGKCTGAYPVALPSISLMVNYDSLGGDGLALSSGLASSMHGDFMMGWTPESIGALVKVCLNEGYKCGDKPTFVGG